MAILRKPTAWMGTTWVLITFENGYLVEMINERMAG
jgi:hypothetical protein